jgi:hypothetical protein
VRARSSCERVQWTCCNVMSGGVRSRLFACTCIKDEWLRVLHGLITLTTGVHLMSCSALTNIARSAIATTTAGSELDKATLPKPKQQTAGSELAKASLPKQERPNTMLGKINLSSRYCSRAAMMDKRPRQDEVCGSFDLGTLNVHRHRSHCHVGKLAH